jgi:sulfide:quinone oxidoreductase
MTAKVLILGDGTGGLITANMLARKARKDGLDIEIKVIGRSPTHTYQPGLLFIPFQKSGYRRLSDIQRKTAKYIGRGVDYLCEEIEALDPERRSVTTNVTTHHYDWLVLSLGSRTVIDDIPGLAEHWGDKAHGFYTPDSALKLAKKLDEFKGGDLVIDVAEMPIKCPVAPLEFAGLVDSYLIKRGLREKTKLTLVTPLSGAFTKPVCNDVLTELLEQKGINVVPNLSLGAVNDDHIESPDGHQVPYDLLVTIPPHEGSDIIEDAGLGDGLGFGLTNKHTLKSMKAERIFLIGDNTNVPTSKAGSVAHFQAEVVVHNLFQEIAGKAADPIADGHRDRPWKGHPDRFQLRHTARSRQVPDTLHWTDDPAARKLPQPPGQAGLQIHLLVHAAAGLPDTAGEFTHEHGRQADVHPGEISARMNSAIHDYRSWPGP